MKLKYNNTVKYPAKCPICKHKFIKNRSKRVCCSRDCLAIYKLHEKSTK